MSGAGAVLREGPRVVRQVHSFVGHQSSVGLAEWTSVVLGLEMANQCVQKGDCLELIADRKNMIEKLAHDCLGMHEQRLQAIFEMAKQLIKEIEKKKVAVKFTHVDRRRNALADRLANHAIDELLAEGRVVRSENIALRNGFPVDEKVAFGDGCDPNVLVKLVLAGGHAVDPDTAGELIKQERQENMKFVKHCLRNKKLAQEVYQAWVKHGPGTGTTTGGLNRKICAHVEGADTPWTCFDLIMAWSRRQTVVVDVGTRMRDDGGASRRENIWKPVNSGDGALSEGVIVYNIEKRGDAGGEITTLQCTPQGSDFRAINRGNFVTPSRSQCEQLRRMAPDILRGISQDEGIVIRAQAGAHEGSLVAWARMYACKRTGEERHLISVRIMRRTEALVDVIGKNGCELTAVSVLLWNVIDKVQWRDRNVQFRFANDNKFPLAWQAYSAVRKLVEFHGGVVNEVFDVTERWFFPPDVGMSPIWLWGSMSKGARFTFGQQIALGGLQCEPYGCVDSSCACTRLGNERLACPFKECSVHATGCVKKAGLAAHLRDQHENAAVYMPHIADVEKLFLCEECMNVFGRKGQHKCTPALEREVTGSETDALGPGSGVFGIPGKWENAMQALDGISWASIFATPCFAWKIPRRGSSRLEVLRIMNAAVKYAVLDELTEIQKCRAEKLIHLLPRMLLSNSRKVYEENVSVRARIVRRSKLFLEGKWDTLIQVPVYSVDNKDNTTGMLKRAANLVAAGELSRAARVLEGGTSVMEVNEDVVKVLQEMHPAEDSQTETEMDTGVDESGQASNTPGGIEDLQDDLRKHLLRSNRMTAGDATGWTLDHIREIARGGGLSSVTKWVTRVISGQVVDDCKPFLYGGRLVPLSKPGKKKPRPVVVGNAWQRAGAGALGVRYRTRVADLCSGVQFGMLPGGSEAIVQLSRSVMEARGREGWVMLQLDISNGYNMIKSKAIKCALRDEGLSELLTYYEAITACTTRLSVRRADGDVSWVVRHGHLAQGDALSPMFFCLATLPAFRAGTEVMKRETPGLEQGILAAYVDDEMIAGPAEAAIEAAVVVGRLLKPMGLSYGLGKSKLLSLSAPDGRVRVALEELGAGWTKEDDSDWVFGRDGTHLLGAPVGTQKFEEEMCVRVVEQSATLLNNIALLPSTQAALLLLRYCAGPRVSYLMRTVPTESIVRSLEIHDNAILRVFSQLFRLTSDDMDERQVTLPVKYGGFGLTAMSKVAPAATLAAAADIIRRRAYLPAGLDQAISLWDIHDRNADVSMCRALDSAITWATQLQDEVGQRDGAGGGRQWPSTVLELPRMGNKAQKWLTGLHASRCFRGLMRDAGTGKKARLRSAAGWGASAFLTTIPTAPELQLSNSQMEYGVLLRLGWVETSRSGGNKIVECAQGAHHDLASQSSLEHRLECASCGGWISRHNQLRDACVYMARQAGFSVYKEPRGEHDSFSANEGGDILVLGAGDHGRHLLTDVVISNPGARSYVNGAADKDQFANSAAAHRKVARYQLQADRADWELLPLPFEIYGAMGTGVRELIARCGRHADSESGEWEVSWATRSFEAFFTQFLSCELVRALYKAQDGHRSGRMAALQWGSWGTVGVLEQYEGQQRLRRVSVSSADEAQGEDVGISSAETDPARGVGGSARAREEERRRKRPCRRLPVVGPPRLGRTSRGRGRPRKEDRLGGPA